MSRITIPRPVFGKITTQLNKPANAGLRKALAHCKQTKAPNGNAILWDPGLDLCANLAGLLERELTFSRKKESTGFKAMQTTIRQLRAWPNHLRAVEKASAA